MGKWPSDDKMDSSGLYSLQWFEFLKFREKSYGIYKVVIYGVGKWVDHMMDWAGCNFHHGRLPDSPVFANEVEAAKWLKAEVEKGTYKENTTLTGHHSGEHMCRKGCSERTISGLPHYFFSSVEEWVPKTEKVLKERKPI